MYLLYISGHPGGKIGNNLLCAAEEYDQIYWVMYSSPAFKFKGSGVVVHPIYWVKHISKSFRFKGINHRQSNKLGCFTDNPIYWDMLGQSNILENITDNPIHFNTLEKESNIMGYIR